MTIENIETTQIKPPKQESAVAPNIKRGLLAYTIITALTFTFFVTNFRAGISIPIFVIIQFFILYVTMPKKKPLLMFVPIFILALNAFISANTMWRVPNFIVAVVLFGVMILWYTNQLVLNRTLTGFVFKTLSVLTTPFKSFEMPFIWCLEGRKENLPIIKRVAIAIAITIPCLIFLLIMLSSADAVFSHFVSEFIWMGLIHFNMGVFVRLLVGFAVAIFLFGLVHYALNPNAEKIDATEIPQKTGDLLILNILFVSIMVIYTVFVAIQFRYLFARPDYLPFGLNFVTYARRGFFELMFLSSVNIGFILLSVWLSKGQQVKNAVKLTKFLCLYLCGVTSVLLVSSFYRMWLYGADDGLTRMRFLVFGFLIFKSFGIIATFIYITKPRFNIIAVYCVIALVYYLFLNIVPMDAIVARSQIDRYFNTGRGGIAYVMTLSPDAAPQIARLRESDAVNTRVATRDYFRQNFSYPGWQQAGWRRWNLSVSRFNRLG